MPSPIPSAPRFSGSFFSKPARAPALAIILASALCACSQLNVREERYADGALKAKSAYLILSDAPVRHGMQATWYPDGGKESLETYVAGYLQGYAFRWYPGGKMKSLEHFTDGRRDGQAKFWDEAGRITACFTAEGADCPRAVTIALPSASRLAARP